MAKNAKKLKKQKQGNGQRKSDQQHKNVAGNEASSAVTHGASSSAGKSTNHAVAAKSAKNNT